MLQKRTAAIALLSSTVVVAIWLAWGLATSSTWDFNALSALFTGLAFSGLVVTVWIQLSQLAEQDKSTQQSLRATTQIGEVLALSQIRTNIGSRINHLKSLRSEQEYAEEGLTEDQIRAEIARNRTRLLTIEVTIAQMIKDLPKGGIQ